MKTKYTKRTGSARVRRSRALGEWRFDDVRAQSYVILSASAAAAGVIEAPVFEEQQQELETAGWIVTVFDNDENTYEQVMAILMIATACTAEEAYMEAWEIDHLGKSVVHYACEKECREAADIISKIGIRAFVSAE